MRPDRLRILDTRAWKAALMGHKFAELAFTPNVKALQLAQGSRRAYERFERRDDVHHDSLGPQEAAFIAARDSFYMATISETGWPYVQHRGGPVGFTKVLDNKTIGFADFRGNRQYISVGNLTSDNRVSLIFLDYANQARLKVLGRAHVVDPSDTETLQGLQLPAYKARVERGVLIDVEAFDWNCPQHITRRFTLDDVEAAMAPLRKRIEELESALKGER